LVLDAGAPICVLGLRQLNGVLSQSIGAAANQCFSYQGATMVPILSEKCPPKSAIKILPNWIL